VRIVFDGSMTDTTVWVNGEQAGETHQGAFYGFHYDITKLLRFGESNTLEVTVAKMSGNRSVNSAFARSRCVRAMVCISTGRRSS